MRELVFKSEKGNPITTSLLVAEKFGKRHSDVLRAIENLECSDEFRQRNFALMVENKELPQGGSSQHKYYIMTESGFTFLAIGFTGKKAGEFKEDYINAFESMRKMVQQLPDFNNPVVAARAWADSEEKRMLANNQIKKLEPKASYTDRVLEHDNQLVDIGQAAKLLKLPFGRNKFFEHLREDGIFFKNRNEPKQQYSHYFDVRKKEIERDEHPDFTVLKVLVKPKGLYWLSKRYGGDYHNGIPQLKIN